MLLTRQQAVRLYPAVCFTGVGKMWVSPQTEIRGNPTIDLRARFIGNAIVHGGEIFGGSIAGGSFLPRCKIKGGNIEGGQFLDCTILSGRIYGGRFIGGVLVRAGVFTGGIYTGGEWDESPLQIQGSRHFFNVSDNTPGRVRVSIGCREMYLSEWLNNWEEIGQLNGYSRKQQAEYHRYLQLASTQYEMM